MGFDRLDALGKFLIGAGECLIVERVLHAIDFYFETGDILVDDVDAIPMRLIPAKDATSEQVQRVAEEVATSAPGNATC